MLVFSYFPTIRLERLEQQEIERLERLRREVLPTAPEPLGFAVNDSQSALARQRAILQKQNAVDLKTLPPMPRFWQKYASQVHGEQQQQSTPVKSPPSFDSMMESPSPSAASEMDFSKDSSSIFSPN